MNLFGHLDKNNLHHAYLIEGEKSQIIPEIFAFFEDLKIKTSGNPDFTHITIDNFKIDEAFDLRAMASSKGFSDSKKVFLISVNSFTLDAQNVLLKMFEEPIENTHFFLVVPDVNALLGTLISRFYFVSTRQNIVAGARDVEKFISMSLQKRIDFIKELLAEEEGEDEEGNEIVVLDSARSKSLKFLNALETTLSKCTFNSKVKCFEQIFKVREFLRMPGSSAKTLMESVALIIPNL
jgi:hypothetical protein